MARRLKVAVILAGCGHIDGSEVREAVLTLLALDQHGVEVQCLAPRAPQAGVVDHSTGRPVPGATRDILVESSRIARVGLCLDLAQADPAPYDALLLPGGAGVAKNLCTFNADGARGTVRPDVAAFVGAFFRAGKPVGAICIAPALVALVLHSLGRTGALTLGDGAGVAEAMAQLGVEHRAVADSRDVVIDEALKLVTTPAYMFGQARLADIWVGIERCVAETLRRVSVQA